MKFVWTLLTALPDLIKGFFGWQEKKLDIVGQASGNAKDVSVAIVQSETSRNNNVRDITLAMMGHPVFWIAWGLGVFPVLTYHACIFWVSTFPGLGWKILRVPPDQMEFAKQVVGSVFTLTGASTVVAGLAHAWSKKA
jgi:hypothetical protein